MKLPAPTLALAIVATIVIAFPLSLRASPPDRRIAWVAIDHFDVRDLDFPSAFHHLLRKAEVASGEQLAFKPVYHTSEAALPSVTLQTERMPFTAVLGYLCDQAGVRATIEGTRVTLTRKQPTPPPPPLEDPEANTRSPGARSEPNLLQKGPEVVGGNNLYRNMSGVIMWKKTGRILHRAASGFSIVDDPGNNAPVDCPHAPICERVCVGARTAKTPTSSAAGSRERALAADVQAATFFMKEWTVDNAWMGALIGTDHKGGAKAALERQGASFPPGSTAWWVPKLRRLSVFATARTLDVINQIVPPAAGSRERAVAAQAPAATLYVKEWTVDTAWMGALIGTDHKGGAKAALERQGVTFPPGSIARWIPVSQKLIVYTTATTLDVIDQIIPARR